MLSHRASLQAVWLPCMVRKEELEQNCFVFFYTSVVEMGSRRWIEITLKQPFNPRYEDWVFH